jgi:GNAT superfamily N-acetyltransferase
LTTVATPAAEQRMIVRRALRAGDIAAISDLHRRVYGLEFDLDERFVAAVARSVHDAVAAGWPERGGAVWLIERDGELAGSLGLTDEGDGIGRVRWFVFEPELRGRGLGRSLIDELLAEARAASLRMLELETFSALAVAAHLYRDAGFELRSAATTDKWGPKIVYQRYELDLA